MKQATAYLVGAGDFTSRGFTPKKGDFIIAADGGSDSLRRLNLSPHLLLGDMDSIRKKSPAGVARLRFPAEKDWTDLELALNIALARGYRQIKCFGALGGRLDHSLANFHLLARCARARVRCCLVDPHLTAFCVHSGKLLLPPLAKGRIVSIFSWGEEARGVSLKGLTYPLDKARLTNLVPLGVSNRGTGKPVYIQVEKGSLLVLVMQAPKRSLK